MRTVLRLLLWIAGIVVVIVALRSGGSYTGRCRSWTAQWLCRAYKDK